MPVTHLTNGDELDALLRDNGRVVVDFFSTECPPCEALASVFEKISEKYPDVKFIKIMRQDNRDLAESFTVMSSPTVLFFKQGKMQDKRLCGRIFEAELDQAVNELMA